MTRLSLSRWEVWRDIVATNPAPVAQGLSEISQRLGELAEAAQAWSEALKEFDLAPFDTDRRGRFFDAVSRGAMGDAGTLLHTQGLPRSLVQSEEKYRELFQEGASFRSRFRMPRKGIVHDLHEFVVRLEDRPGQLLALLEPLAQAGVNVVDVEILKVREGESGTVLLGFASAEEATRARDVLGNDRFLVMDR